jgi:beta-1,4-mannooligosaccharide/beta-1,4-mannosyl-N-acetylglucosamine phosphorylase
MKDATKILARHIKNPLIDPEDYPGVHMMFNPSPALYDGKTILLISVVKFKNKYGGETWVAESADGINFTVNQNPFFNLYDKEYPFTLMNKHLIDNRLTKIDDTYYLITPVGNWDYSSPCGVLGKTKDFKTYEVMDIITAPPNRGASLFPEKINGKYYKLDRPGSGTGNFGDIWISSSPDLIHWGYYRPVIRPYADWNSTKMGPTPPIKTDKGWLVIIHGCTISCGSYQYYIGAMLLDLSDPSRVIGKTYSYLLRPDADYEISGITDNVVFPCGALADFKTDTLKLYYGAADTRICLAEGSIKDIVTACLEEI